MAVLNKKIDAAAEKEEIPYVSTRFSLSIEMSVLTRDGTAVLVSRDQILRRESYFPVQLTTSRIGSLTRLIHTLAIYVTTHYIHAGAPAATRIVSSFFPSVSWRCHFFRVFLYHRRFLFVWQVVVAVVVFFTLTDRASTIPSNIRDCQSGTVRGLLDRKRSEEHHHLHGSNESMKTEQNIINSILLLPRDTVMVYYLLHFLCFVFTVFLVSLHGDQCKSTVQYNGGLLLDIILLTQCYFHRGTRLNAMKGFCICSL